MKVDFHDNGPNEMIMLDEINACVYSGTFENEEVAVAISSVDCPMTESSMMQVYIL